jgi:DNA-binding CsgD family transcriptional regulator
MNQFSRMKMYTNYLADSYKHIFDHTPICHWGYLYYDSSGRYLQLLSESFLLDEFFTKELYADQIAADIDLISDKIYVSDIINDHLLSPSLKEILLNRDFTYFFDYMRRNIDSDHNYSMEIITFASFTNPFITNNFLMNNIDVLNKICEDFAQKCHRLLTKENTIILPKDFMININETFTTNIQNPNLNLKTNLFKPHVKNSKLALLLKENTFDFNLLPFSFLAAKDLTHKEKEVIYLYFFGFNSGRIASILDISKRTVEKYFENIRKKLKCESTGQIIPTLLVFDNSLQTSLRKSYSVE